VFKRIGLFLLTNFAILITLNVIWALLSSSGVIRNTDVLGAYGPLMGFSVVFGFGGAIISLLISKWTAKMMTGAQVIEAPRNANEAWLLDAVRRHANRAGIGMPEVAVYDSPEMNAFATGASRNHALVAVSAGLLRSMDRTEVEAVLGHEITHIENGDMVTLTLIQGVLNTFVIFLSRVIGGIIDSALRGRDDRNRGGGLGYFFTVMILQTVFGLLASLIIAWFSRRREFRADRGGATLAGTPSMINALRRLGQGQESGLPQAMAAFGISGGGGLLGLLRSHPPLEVRIRALQEKPA
jgi:heat shock protein HtpX